jgi:hypothetical protein
MTWGQQTSGWDFPGGWWFGRRLGSSDGREYSEDEIQKLERLTARCEGACCQVNLKPKTEDEEYAP